MASRIPKQVIPDNTGTTTPSTTVPDTTSTTVAPTTTTNTVPSAVSGTGTTGSDAITAQTQAFADAVVAKLQGEDEENKLNEPPMRGFNRPATVGIPGVIPAAQYGDAYLPTQVKAPGLPGYNSQTDEPGLIDLDGTFLTDENGQRYIYDAEVDGFNTYYSATDSQRELIADVLRDTGWNIESIDDYIDGYQYLYAYANAAGVSFNRAVLEYRADAPKKKQGRGPTYRVTSSEDIKAVAKTAAYKILGRGFTEAEANDFVKAYQQTQISAQQQAAASGVAEAAPDISVAATSFAQKAAPSEAMGIKFANHVAGFANALGAV